MVIIFIALFISFSSKVTSAAGGTAQDDLVVQEILQVAEAVKAVERAGGPLKILQDPRFRGLSPPLKRVLQGLDRVLQDDPPQSEIQPRMVGGLMLLGLKSLVNVFTIMMRPKTAEVDLEMDF